MMDTKKRVLVVGNITPALEALAEKHDIILVEGKEDPISTYLHTATTDEQIYELQKCQEFYDTELRIADPQTGLMPKKIKGVRAAIRTEPKIGRNQPCTCGSGKKYKKCCLWTT